MGLRGGFSFMASARFFKDNTSCIMLCIVGKVHTQN